MNRTRAAAPGLQTLFHAGSLVGVTDGQLLERFALRDGASSEAAFAALVERHERLVWQTCRSVLRDDHDAADAFQATFLVLVRRAGSLWVRDSLAPWLHRVALRAAIRAGREARRRARAERSAAELHPVWTASEGPDDMADVLHREIDRLPDRHRVVVVLCDLQGRSLEEAARHLRCPVGTVKSRLARARGRLREALVRRGVAPMALARVAGAAIEGSPRGLVASAVRGSASFAVDPNNAAGLVSKPAVILAEGVLKTMIRTRWQVVVLAALTASGLLVPGWLTFARQDAGDRPASRAPAAGPKAEAPPGDYAGNWIIRLSGGQAFALIRIEGPSGRPEVRLLAFRNRTVLDLGRSSIDHVRIDAGTVRFTLHLSLTQGQRARSIEIVAHRPEDRPGPTTLRGAWIQEDGRAGGRGAVSSLTLERTDRTALDPNEADPTAPAQEDFRRQGETRDPAKRREILEEFLEKRGDTPLAATAAWCLAINRNDAGAPEAEVRALIDRTARLAARDGRETEIGAISLIVDNLIGAEGRDAMILEYARKAASMLRPEDPSALQIPTLKNLVAVLRRSSAIDPKRAEAEARALEDRIATLARREGREPAPPAEARGGSATIPWARNFAEARRRARAEGKRILVVLAAPGGRWSAQFGAGALSRPEVVEAMRPFVPVQVDPDDGEGRPLVARKAPHLEPAYQTILFLDPGNDATGHGRLVGQLPLTFLPATSLVERLQTIARLPTDLETLRRKARPNDGEAMRQLATALAMQGQIEEAAAMVDRAWGPGADPHFDRWAAVDNTIGIELMLRSRRREARDWFGKAARVAKRPIDAYNAHLGAAFAAIFEQDAAQFIRELEAAARVDGVPADGRDFARQWLDRLSKPIGAAAPAPKADAVKKPDPGDAAKTRVDPR